ncbi:MAG TPA: hypothetical protein VGM88_22460 [Kofleriaceae bacterium]|jgi:hypothetical protein
MRALSFVFAASVAVTAACGGGESRPGPIGKHFDEQYIVEYPIDQKQAVVQTQNDFNVAKMENATAEHKYNEFESQLSVAKNDAKAAKLGVDSAKTNKKSADTSADQNRMNEASKQQHAAELLAKAADARVKYFQSYAHFLDEYRNYTAATMYWREAQYELAKSQLAQKNNKAPKGVNYGDYSKQEGDRSNAAQHWKGKSDSARSKAISEEANWKSAQDAADRENGHPSMLADPLAPNGPSAGQQP